MADFGITGRRETAVFSLGLIGPATSQTMRMHYWQKIVSVLFKLPELIMLDIKSFLKLKPNMMFITDKIIATINGCLHCAKHYDKGFYTLSHLKVWPNSVVGDIFVPILWARKLRTREMEGLAHGNYLGPGLLDPILRLYLALQETSNLLKHLSHFVFLLAIN